jgi:hypothetical protein
MFQFIVFARAVLGVAAFHVRPLLSSPAALTLRLPLGVASNRLMMVLMPLLILWCESKGAAHKAA